MCGGKKQEVIDCIKKMTDKEADILAVFVAGFNAGRQVTEKESRSQIHCTSVEKTA